ncbi:hypothetical protein BC833DRAFT_646351, partial [Globomyces pollinis-pini]
MKESFGFAFARLTQSLQTPQELKDTPSGRFIEEFSHFSPSRKDINIINSLKPITIASTFIGVTTGAFMGLRTAKFLKFRWFGKTFFTTTFATIGLPFGLTGGLFASRALLKNSGWGQTFNNWRHTEKSYNSNFVIRISDEQFDSFLDVNEGPVSQFCNSQGWQFSRHHKTKFYDDDWDTMRPTRTYVNLEFEDDDESPRITVVDMTRLEDNI